MFVAQRGSDAECAFLQEKFRTYAPDRHSSRYLHSVDGGSEWILLCRFVRYGFTVTVTVSMAVDAPLEAVP